LEKRLNAAEAAQRMKEHGVSTSPGVLGAWRHYNRGPRFVRIGGRIFYEPSAVDEFCKGIKVETEDSLQLGRIEG